MSAPHDLCVLVCSILKWQQQQERRQWRRRGDKDGSSDGENECYSFLCASVCTISNVWRRKLENVKRSLLSGCVMLLLLLAVAVVVAVFLFFFFIITPSFHFVGLYLCECMCKRARHERRRKKCARDRQAKWIEWDWRKKSDSVAKRYTKRNRFGKSPLEKFVDFSI